jgi:hypothetical protein
MIDVARVYNIVRDLCNKDQKGFVSPEVFNTFASAAQQNVFNEMFTELKMATRLRASNADSGRDKSVYKQVEEDLSYYIVEALLPDTDFVAETTEGEDDAVNPDEAYIARKPLNLARIISMTVANTNTSVELVYDAEQGARILNSNLSAPTEDFPVALIMSNTIQVFPDTLAGDGVNIKYYRSPRSAYPIDILETVEGEDPIVVFQAGDFDLQSQPRYSTVNLDPESGLVVQNLVDSRNFDLPSHYLTEVVAEICKMIGVRLRDKDLFAFANQETQAN